MKRSQLLTAIALSLGVTGWFSPWLSSPAWAADCDRPRASSCGCADADRGLLDTLDDLACKTLDNRSRRPSMLSTLKANLSKSSRTQQRCDQPTCGAEPACGIEAGCGVEPACGVEPECGVEPGCGVAERGVRYVPRDITMNHHVSPIDVSRQVPPPMRQQAPQPRQIHPKPPQVHQVPPHMQNVPQVPVQPRMQQVPHMQQLPALPTMPAPRVQPAPPASPVHPVPPGFEAIPVPEVQDSITDPFRDDSATQFRPRRTQAHPATHRLPVRKGASHGRQPILNYDPQARTTPAHGHIGSDPEPVTDLIAETLPTSSRLGAERHFNEMGASASLSSRISERSTGGAADVVPASATEPVQLPPLKAVPHSQSSEVSDGMGALRNPLRG